MKPAEALEGLDLDGGWHVKERIKKQAKGTGGYSSISYLAINREGKEAFLKALDFSSAVQSDDISRSLLELTSAYEHERSLLHQCKDKKLRHVVVPLADGTAKLSDIFGELSRVPYLIFPKATGDIRSEVERWREFEKRFDLAWALRSLHHSSIGLQELHGMNIAHQDVKPSNVLVFPDKLSKLTDLGSASQVGKPSKSDREMIPGDISYAAPEQWYSWSPSGDFENRYLVDLYRLGSLVFYFFADCSATDAVQLKISIKYGREFVRSDFSGDLPYIEHAFEESLSDLRILVGEIAGDLTEEIVLIAQQLCDPDPRRRGDPSARAAKYRRQYDVQAYVSRFNMLARKAEYRMI